MTRVLLLVLDGLSPRHVRPDVTPTLVELGEAGGWNRHGGRGVLPASTYPNHATFATGVAPARHGLWSDKALVDGRLLDAWEVGPAAPTVFDACRDAGRSSAAVFGDHHLVGAMGAARADRCWPSGAPGPELAQDAFGYADDEPVGARIAAAVVDGPDLVVAELNGPDTAAHVFGPDADDALAAYRRTDAAVAVVRDALASHWDDWVAMIVSDHSQETVTIADPVDLRVEAERRGAVCRVIEDGSAAVVAGDHAWVRDVPGVEGTAPLADGAIVAWGAPVAAFARGPWPLPGLHGSPRTRPQVAIVCGGAPEVAALARWVEAQPPDAAEWAGVALEVLQISARGERRRPVEGAALSTRRWRA